MRPATIATLVASVGVACGHPPPGRPAPVPIAACLNVPTALGRFTRTETHTYEDSAAGIGYRFSDGSRDRVTVFVYPIPADVRIGSDQQTWVAAEAKKFHEAFPIGVQRGWYDAYELSFANPEPIQVKGAPVPGFVAAAVTRKGNATAVEVEYLYVICDHFLKVRGTLDGRTWSQSPVPLFAKDLAAELAGR